MTKSWPIELWLRLTTNDYIECIRGLVKFFVAGRKIEWVVKMATQLAAMNTSNVMFERLENKHERRRREIEISSVFGAFRFFIWHNVQQSDHNLSRSTGDQWTKVLHSAPMLPVHHFYSSALRLHPTFCIIIRTCQITNCEKRTF